MERTIHLYYRELLMKLGVIIWLSAVCCMSGGNFLISCIFQFFFSKISISKAFDKVWHAGFLCKLEALGVQPLLLQLFESYLLNRKQRVVQYRRAILWFANSQLRSPSRVFDRTASIFFIYINDITGDLASLPLIYADDTTLFTSQPSQLVA